MRITPLEIRQKAFEKKMRGYDKDAVDAYINTLSHEWERLLDENKSITLQLASSKKDVDKLREVEEQLFKTLKTAEETGNKLVEQANRSAELTMKEAQMNAEAMLAEAKAQVNDMLDRADEHVRQVLGSLNDEAKKIEANIRIAENNRDNVIREIRLLANDALEKVGKMNTNPVKVSIPKVAIEKPTNSFEVPPTEVPAFNALKKTPKSQVDPIESTTTPTSDAIHGMSRSTQETDTPHTPEIELAKNTTELHTEADEKATATEFNFEVNTTFEEGVKKDNLPTDEKKPTDEKPSGGSFFDLLED